MSAFLDIHTHHCNTSTQAVAIQSLSLTQGHTCPSDRLVSIGIHPWFGNIENLDEDIALLHLAAKNTNVKLIGECGLDKLRGPSITDQITILTAQINLAEKLGKPLILHCVKAYDELIALKKSINPSVPLIIHGFNKSPELAQQLVNNGFFLSFGAAIFTSNAASLAVEAITQPFFLETDESAIPIEEIYSKVAEIKKITLQELKDAIFANWKNFNII